MVINIPFDDPLYVQWHVNDDGSKYSVLIDNEPHQITKGCFTLTQIPDSFNKVYFNNRTMYEIDINEDITNNQQFKVNYGLGIVFTHPDLDGQYVNIKYHGRGVIMYPSNRIYDNTTNGELQEPLKTLEDYINSIKPYGYKGNFSPDTPYTPNSMVSYDYGVYRCNKLSLGILPTDTEYWECMMSVKVESQYAITQGDYAKSQGDYAKQEGDNTKTAIANANTATTNANNSANNANNVAQQLTDETLIIWKPYVNTLADIATNYPTPIKGWVTQTKDTGARYRWSGAEWVNIGVYPDDNVGDLTQLNTTSKNNIVESVNEVNNKIGNISTLTTTNKANTVGAINELATQIDTDIIPKVHTHTNKTVLDLISELNGILAYKGIKVGEYYPTVTGEVGVTNNKYPYGDIRRYGAIGDGVTNCTSYIQNAINSINAIGGSVFAPVGTFMSDTLTIPSGTTIVGENKYTSIIKLIASPTGALLELSGTSSAVKEKIMIRNLTLTHKTGYTKVDEIKGVLIRGYYVRYIDIENVVFTDFSVYGILGSVIDNNNTYARSFNITNCIFQNATGSSSKGIFLYNEGEYVRISGCVFHTLTCGVTSNGSANTRIVDCTFLKCGSVTYSSPSIYVAGTASNNNNKTIISNCAINHNEYIPIIINAQGAFNHGVIISGNNILVNETSPYHCVRLEGVIGAVISCNRMRAGNSTYVQAIHLANDSSTGAKTNYSIITNNVFLGGAGWLNSSGTTDNLANNNHENIV